MIIIERHQLKYIFAGPTHPAHPVLPEQQLLRPRLGHHAIPRLRPQRWIDQHTVALTEFRGHGVVFQLKEERFGRHIAGGDLDPEALRLISAFNTGNRLTERQHGISAHPTGELR
ncbi:Uncharacterised protein [Delftia tsuruhatensis]|nr:Uncharacterised protein [Delftia tsuruhatensis]